MHFNAAQTSKGGGSSITSSYGFVANNLLAVGTFNYGILVEYCLSRQHISAFLDRQRAILYWRNVSVMLNGTTFDGEPSAYLIPFCSAMPQTSWLYEFYHCTDNRIYGTTTVLKYLSPSHDGTNAIIDTNASAGRLSLGGNATSIFGLSHLLFTDNTFDIGASGATRPRSGYFSASITVGTSIIVGASQVVATRYCAGRP